MALFGAAMTFKVFDILRAGEISNELRIPVWIGYTLASIGIIAAVVTAAIRWCAGRVHDIVRSAAESTNV